MRHQLSLENTTLKRLMVENEVVRDAARTSSEQYVLPRPSSPVFMKSTTTIIPTTASTSTSTSIVPGPSEPCKTGPQSLLQKPAKRPFAHLFPADDTFMST